MSQETATPGPEPATEPTLHTQCELCGYQFKTPRKRGRCNTTAACEKRQQTRDTDRQAAAEEAAQVAKAAEPTGPGGST